MRLEYVGNTSVRLNPPWQVTVEMEYIGAILSVNHYKVRGIYTHPKTRKWMDELAFILRLTANSAGITFKSPLRIQIEGQFKDKRSKPDLHNLIKVIADSVELATDIDDVRFIVKTGQPTIGEPKLTITVSSK